jgi:hypothetical protein
MYGCTKGGKKRKYNKVKRLSIKIIRHSDPLYFIKSNFYIIRLQKRITEASSTKNH